MQPLWHFIFQSPTHSEWTSVATLPRTGSNDRSKRAPSRSAALPIDARARMASRILLAVLLVLLSLWLAQEFLAPLGWAVVIAITTWPLYLRFAEHIPGRLGSVHASGGCSAVFSDRSRGASGDPRGTGDCAVRQSLQGERNPCAGMASASADRGRICSALVARQPQ